MSPPQHAHFMTSKCHKDEILFLSLVFLAIDYASLPLSFSIVISMVTWYIGDAVSNYTFSPLYNNLQISFRQETAIVVELLNKTTQEGFAGLFCLL
jgi:hypothetical protein